MKYKKLKSSKFSTFINLYIEKDLILSDIINIIDNPYKYSKFISEYFSTAEIKKKFF